MARTEWLLVLSFPEVQGDCCAAMGRAGRLPDSWVWHGVGRSCACEMPSVLGWAVGWPGWLVGCSFVVRLWVVQADIAEDACCRRVGRGRGERGGEGSVGVPGLVHFHTARFLLSLSLPSLTDSLVTQLFHWDCSLGQHTHTRTLRPHRLRGTAIRHPFHPQLVSPAPLFPLVSLVSLPSRCPPHSQPASQAVQPLARLASTLVRPTLSRLAHRVQLDCTALLPVAALLSEPAYRQSPARTATSSPFLFPPSSRPPALTMRGGTADWRGKDPQLRVRTYSWRTEGEEDKIAEWKRKIVSSRRLDN